MTFTSPERSTVNTCQAVFALNDGVGVREALCSLCVRVPLARVIAHGDGLVCCCCLLPRRAGSAARERGVDATMISVAICEY